MRETKFITHWRPAAAWVYLGICIMDFAIAPIIFLAAQVYAKLATFTVWDPLTLRGAGVFHIAFGALLGITAAGRTKEKIALGQLPSETEGGK